MYFIMYFRTPSRQPGWRTTYSPNHLILQTRELRPTRSHACDEFTPSIKPLNPQWVLFSHSCNAASCQRNQDLENVRNLFKVTEPVSGRLRFTSSLIPQHLGIMLFASTNKANQQDQAKWYWDQYCQRNAEKRAVHRQRPDLSWIWRSRWDWRCWLAR